jgi:hypothetical protein
MCTILFLVDYTSTSTKVQNMPFIAKASICYTFCAKVCKIITIFTLVGAASGFAHVVLLA